jgi:hypothetical protein
MSEARIGHLEEDVHEIRAVLGRLEPVIIRIDAVLPHLATKAELADLRTEMTAGLAALRVALADKPGRLYMWGVMAALTGAYTAALAAAALLLTVLQAHLPASHALAAPIVLAGEAFDWDRYHARQDACLEADRIAAQCTRGIAFCDELALRQARRACSVFTGDRR